MEAVFVIWISPTSRRAFVNGYDNVVKDSSRPTCCSVMFHFGALEGGVSPPRTLLDPRTDLEKKVDPISRRREDFPDPSHKPSPFFVICSSLRNALSSLSRSEILLDSQDLIFYFLVYEVYKEKVL
ncbi:hypothetical protein AVEN_232834-1 [Araneus ventricosus]|uniref:Uncharacterized protein n=1 Tax=Araneus ventricosus TaxID=182803 RepID=A0A4Y2LZY7_ARAVE|nr:hypothetical protein AVEN_232834-1 [Araneus ventricosus]